MLVVVAVVVITVGIIIRVVEALVAITYIHMNISDQ